MANRILLYVLLITVVLFLNVSHSHSKSRQFLQDSKTILKTIKGDVDIIDCVDIYKQPAFSHPLLVNHTLQLEPSFDTSRGVGSEEDGKFGVRQSWLEYVECPNGSIPIVRPHNKGTTTTSPLIERKVSSPFLPQENDKNESPLNRHQYAIVHASKAGRIHGAHANINNWSPRTNPDGGSISQLWITAGTAAANNLNTIEVGWQVAPYTGSSRPRLFIYWTRDGYKTTGCYNLDCPGFVQTSHRLPVNALIANISVYGGVQFDVSYGVKKDKSTQNWWLTVNGIALGYWPSKLFTKLSGSGDIVAWGGEVIDKIKTPTTQMGSGHFPRESYTKSSYIRELKYVNPSGNYVYLGQYELQHLVTNPSCYDLHIERRRELYLFYGGPGCTR